MPDLRAGTGKVKMSLPHHLLPQSKKMLNKDKNSARKMIPNRKGRETSYHWLNPRQFKLKNSHFNKFSVCDQFPTCLLALSPCTNTCSPGRLPRHSVGSGLPGTRRFPSRQTPILQNRLSLLSGALLDLQSYWIKTLCEHPLQSVLSHHYSWMSSPPFSLPNTLPLSFKFGRNEIFYHSLQCSRCQNNAEPALGKDLSIPQLHAILISMLFFIKLKFTCYL